MIKLKVILLFFALTGLLPNSATAQSLNFLLRKADSLLKLDDYIAAEKTYEDALARAVIGKKQDTTGLIYLRIGIVYGRRGDYDKALEFYFKALPIFETITQKSKIAAVKRNIGIVYWKIGKLEDAFSYANSAYLEWSRLKDSVNIFYSFNDFGLIRMDQKRYNEALAFFDSVLTSPNTSQYQKIRSSAITNLASVYWMKKNYSKAVSYYQQIYQLRKDSGDKNGMALILLNLGGLYNDMHQYNKALNATQQGIKLAKEVNAKELLLSGYSYLSEVYENTGNYKKAYASAIESMAWKDSIYTEDSSQFKYFESNYLHQQEKSRREQKETENRLLNEQNKLEKKENEYSKKRIEQSKLQLRIVIIIAALIILSLFLFYKAYRTRQRNERIIEKQRSVILESQLKESELTALRAQMNPHFIFNALSSIKNYMLEQNVQLADYYLGKFAKLIGLSLIIQVKISYRSKKNCSCWNTTSNWSSCVLKISFLTK